MTRSGPEERLTVTNEPKGIMSPAALRVLSLTTSSACSRKLGLGLGRHGVGATECVEIIDVE